MTTASMIETAEKHIGKGAMVSSAKLCLDDAVEMAARGDYRATRMWAMRSLAYSVGIFHPDYRAVEAA